MSINGWPDQMMTLDEAENVRMKIMGELELIVTCHNNHGLYGTARRYQHALIELHNCAPVTPFQRANGEKTGARKKP